MRRIHLGFLIAITLAVATVTGTARQSASGSISGTVVRADGGGPVARAVVTLGDVSVMTGDDGKFAFLRVMPGDHRLVASGPGYAPGEYGQGYPPRPNAEPTLIAVSAGTQVSGVVVALTAGGVINGRVVDLDGVPIRGAHVDALQYSYQEGWRVLEPVTRVFETNDLGEFRMFWLGPGSYVLRAVPARPEGSVMEPAPTYFPGVTDSRAASPIAIRAGETLGVTLRMVEARLARIDGLVVDGLSGMPIPARLTLAPRTPESAPRLYRNSSAPDVTGAATTAFSIIGVPPGSYYLYAIASGSPARLMTRVPMEIGDRDIDNLTVVVNPLAVQGRVTLEDWPEGFDATQVRTRMAVVMELDPPILSVNEQRDGIAPRLLAPVADGAFAFPAVMPADYRVSMNIAVPGMADAYVKSIRFLDSDVIDEGLHLDNRAAPWLDVVVGVNGASVGGVVLDGRRQPLQRATVALIPENRKQVTLFKDTRTDALGRFQIHGVRPGAYKLFAWEEIEYGSWFDSEVIRADESLAINVIADNGAHMDAIEIQAIPWRH